MAVEYINDGQEAEYTVEGHDVFDKWMEDARVNNTIVYYRVFRRLRQIGMGNFGDHKSVGGGVFELRLHFGAGYRLYYTIIGRRVVFMLCAGDKSEQKRDVKLAQKLLKEVRDGKEV